MSDRVNGEEALIERAKAGDEEALARLYEDNVQAIYQYVSYRVGDTLVAEDLTAETFLRAYESLDDYEYRGKAFRAFLYRIAQARVADHHRLAGRRPTVPLDSMTFTSNADVERDVSRILRREQVFRMLEGLTEPQRQVIIMRFLQGYSNKEVAELLGKSVGAVKLLQFRGLRRLGRQFNAQAGMDGSGDGPGRV